MFKSSPIQEKSTLSPLRAQSSLRVGGLHIEAIYEPDYLQTLKIAKSNTFLAKIKTKEKKREKHWKGKINKQKC